MDALLLAGMFPSEGPHAVSGQQTIKEHVILIAPAREGAPLLPSLARTTRGPDDWIRVSSHLPAVIDRDLFVEALATLPAPSGTGDVVNALVVHYSRRGDDGGSMRCFMAHNDELAQPRGSEKLDDDDWVHNTFTTWLDGE